MSYDFILDSSAWFEYGEDATFITPDIDFIGIKKVLIL